MSDASPPRAFVAATTAVALLGFACLVADAVLDVAFPLDAVGGVVIAAGSFAIAWGAWSDDDGALAATVVGSTLCLLSSFASDFGDGLASSLLGGALVLFGLVFVAVGARNFYARSSA